MKKILDTWYVKGKMDKQHPVKTTITAIFESSRNI